MNANRDLERRLVDFYAGEGLLRAPDRVLTSALATIEATPQRRALSRVPWRFPNMSNYARLAVAAVAALAVVALGWGIFVGRPPGPGATPSPSPSVGPSPTTGSTPLPSAPSPTPVLSGPALTETFTSAMHGISIDYPGSWQPRLASEAWISGIPFQGSAFFDVLLGPVGASNTFLGVASQVHAGRSDDDWASAIAAHPDWGDTCDPVSEAVAIDGQSGILVVHCDGTATALVSEGDRGYLVVLYGGEPVSWFKEILATVQLNPQDALARYETEFQLPFSYVLPDGAQFDYGTTNETWFEVRVPAFADAGHPGGVILQAIYAGVEDPCVNLSNTLPIEAGAQAVIDYLKTVPQLEVSDEAQATVGDLPAVQATIFATTTTGCPDVWPFVENTEPVPGNMPLRIVAVDVGDEHLVFTIFGEGDNPDWPAMANQLIGSIDFTPIE